MKNKLILGLAIVVVVVVGLGAIAARMGQKMVEEARHDIAGLALDIGKYEAGFLTAQLILKDIRIYPAGQETPDALLASADKLYVKLAPLDLLSGKLHIKKIELKRPDIRYVITGRKSTNWDTLDLGQKDAEKKDPKQLPVIVDKVEIDDGTVSYVNKMNGQHIELKDVDISVDDIRPAKKPGDMPTEIEFDAKIGNSSGKISMEGKADLLGNGISFDINGDLSSTPIGEFASFYAGQVPFQIVAGSIAVSSKAKAVDNKLTSSHYATISGLKTGGGLKGDIVNRFLELHREPIGINVAVNGDLSTGQLSVSSALSKSLGEEIIKMATLSVPGAALEKVKELIPGKGSAAPLKRLKGLFKK